jgi:dipeptidase E
MKSALLISNSTSHGSGYLDHCEKAMKDYLGDVREVLFVPYASPDRDSYEEKARERFGEMGYAIRSLHRQENPGEAVAEADAIFIGGGNTFLLLRSLYEDNVVELIRTRVEEGMKYMGTSAGSNVACATINTTNDMPIVYPPTFDAIGLVPFILNPHYLDPDPGSTHKGETRMQRIREFHKLEDTPVLGLRESAILHLEGDSLTLEGPTGAKLFKRGEDPVEYSPGSDLSFLMKH